MVNKVKFERDNVVHIASQLFWQKGFHATSTRDLQDAINMRPGSIYAAFGSKEGLFAEALKSYAQLMKNQMQKHLAEQLTVLEGLEAFVRQIIIDDKHCQPSEICMLVKTNAELFDEQPTLKALNQQLLHEFESSLSEIFDTASQQKCLTNNLTAIEYARYFQIQFTGLRHYLHRPESEHLADTLITQMFTLLKRL